MSTDINVYKMIIKKVTNNKIKNIFFNFIKNHDRKTAKINKNFDSVSKTSYHLNPYDIDLVNLYSQYLEMYVNEMILYPSKMNCIWYQIYNKNSGSYHDYHTHCAEDCQISGIYYIKLKDKKISTEFIVDQTVFQLDDVAEGDIVLFDSKISHRSPPNNTDQDKIIVSFNLDCR